MKRKLALLLCAALLAASFASCGSEPSGASSGVDVSAPNSSAADSGADSDAPLLPYTGEEIVYQGYGYDGLTIDPDSTCQKAWKEKVGNIRVEWQMVPFNDYSDKVKVYLNSGDIPDILPLENLQGTIDEFGATGALLDFAPYEKYMPNLQEYRKQYPNMDYLNTKEGNRYGIMGVQPIDAAGETWWVNMDTLEKYGLSVPSTFEEMLAAMRTIKEKDPTAIPFQSYWNLNYPKTQFALGMNAVYDLVYWDSAANEYKCSLREPDAKRRELITLMTDMYKEGLVNPEIQTMSFEQETAAIAQGEWAFSFTYLGSMEREIFKVEATEDLPFNIQPMAAPASADGSRYLPIVYQHDSIPWWGIVCSADAKQPEYLAAYMDMVVSPFSRDLFNYGVEGVTYDVKDGVPTIREGINRTAEGIGSIYEVWMVGMGPTVRTDPSKLASQAMEANLQNYLDGTVKASFLPTLTTFGADAAEEKAKLETALQTFVDETEAKFIYNQRDIAEWDSYVKEAESIASIDRLLELYNSADIIVRSPDRIFAAE